MSLPSEQEPVSGLASSQQVDDRRFPLEVQDVKPKGSKKSRSKGKKKGTGFEEYYCDPPLTPAEYNEERNILYPPHRPFVDRIEECIQRFRARRRMDCRREHLFSRYLALGGVDATVRQFQSTRNLTDEDLEGATKAVVREITADDVIQRGSSQNSRFYNPNYPEHWDVDFTGVVSGFLSDHLPKFAGADMNDFLMGVEVVANFLKYVDHHDVCPEYAQDIKNALAICQKAPGEFAAIWSLPQLGPGAFNMALRMLYCKNEENGPSESGRDQNMAGDDLRHAQRVQAVALSALPGLISVETGEQWVVTGTFEHTFEISEVTLPDAVIRAKYKAVNQHFAGSQEIRPCGTITVRPVVIRDGWENTMNETIPPEIAGESSFVLEEDILQLLEIGMKLTLEVCTLNVGIKFIKSIQDIKPSFYLFLPQQLMLNYREPVPNNRPAPSIHDNDADEDVLTGIPLGGQED